MARIKTYTLDSEINPADKVIGTDGAVGVNFGKTKNYSISDLASYFSSGEGAAGASAYQIWLNNGNTGTEQDFLNSLIGAAGSQGPTGAAGAQGAAGADGTSITIQGTKNTVGDLPSSGSVGDLWIISQTGGGATAGDGYVWTDGGAWLNIGPIRGPQGIQGAQGPQGIQGIQGAQGAQGIQGAAGAAGTKFELMTGTTAVLCDQNGNVTGDYANLAYSVRSLVVFKTQVKDTSTSLYTFSVYIVVNTDSASNTFFAGNNPLSVKLQGLNDTIDTKFSGHLVNAIVQFEQLPGGTDTQAPGVIHGVLASGADHIKLVASEYNFKTGAITYPGGLSTSLVKDDTSFFTVQLNGIFQGQ